MFRAICSDAKSMYLKIDLTCKSPDASSAWKYKSSNGKRAVTRSKEMNFKLKSFCRSCSGLGVHLGGIGARDENKLLENFWYFYFPTLNEAKGLLCVPNAIAHGVLQFFDVNQALKCLPVLSRHNRQFPSFKTIDDIIRGLGCKLSVRKPGNYDTLKRMVEIKTDSHKVMEEVCSWKRGVRIIWLHTTSPHSVDHCVCVDFGNEHILDGTEPFALTFSED